jgi:N utilization substance protein A
MEVPEIYEGTVIVKNAVREPGDRAKVAVFSKESDVDPVGACVGIKGARVQNIIRELRGEKIDIVEWDEDARSYAINALNPAKVSRVSILDEKDKVMEVVVEDKQLSLAIGKRGQNVRLAARLLGWRIDIKSEEDKKLEVQSQMDAALAIIPVEGTDIRLIEGVGEKTMRKLIAYGFTSLEKLIATPDAVTEVDGVGVKTAEKLVAQAHAYLASAQTPSNVVEDDPAPNEGEPRNVEEVLAMSVAEGSGGVAEAESGSDGLDDASGGER